MPPHHSSVLSKNPSLPCLRRCCTRN
jgi:hypothetical protein